MNKNISLVLTIGFLILVVGCGKPNPATDSQAEIDLPSVSKANALDRKTETVKSTSNADAASTAETAEHANGSKPVDSTSTARSSTAKSSTDTEFGENAESTANTTEDAIESTSDTSSVNEGSSLTTNAVDIATNETADGDVSATSADNTTADANTDEKDPEPTPQTPQTPQTPERLLVLTSGGPLVADLLISIDGKSHLDRATELIQHVLKTANEDSNAETTWQELANSKAFRYGQYGNPQAATEQQRRNLITQYDINRDDRVDENEVLGYLRQSPAEQDAFSLQAESADSRYSERVSPFFRSMDRDQDDLLDEAELKLAKSRLWMNDLEDNRILTSAEFPDLTANPNMRRNRGGSRPPKKVIHLSKHVRWLKVLLELEEKYSYRNVLSKDDLTEFASWFDHLDADADEVLSKEEFAKIADLEPHIVISINFNGTNQSKIQVQSAHPDIQIKSKNQADNRLVLSAGGSTVEFSIFDSFSPNSTAEQAKAIFERADTNKDAYLVEDEFAVLGQIGVTLQAADADENEMVHLEELEAALRNRELAQANRISCRIDSQRDVAFSFVDDDDDGRITAREMDTLADRLKTRDTNQDGYVAFSEFPTAISVNISRGAANVAPQFRTEVVTPDSSVSGWFENMDTNRDGEVCPREFIGSLEKFKSLDQDQNGYLEPSEFQD